MTEPTWMERPNRPGLWLLDCITEKPSLRWLAMELNQEDLDRGAPFGTRRVFGPVEIPPADLCKPIQS